MARTRRYNSDMQPLREKIADYMGKQTEIRAHYAMLAEQEIAKLRDEVLDEMFIVHAGAGPSEIANSTGVSRTTVIRWRKEFMERMAENLEAGEDVAAAVEQVVADKTLPDKPYTEIGSEKYDGYPTAYAVTPDGPLWLLTGEDFGIGESPYEAEDNRVDRPDWMTDDVMRKIVYEANVKLMLAPW
ncbi:hypothetical protein ISF9_085 [Microbacterium phage vB_MoxS-ISF9]|uniref:Uncharacterized protein n=1 Tax=Microbacterium phage vB_MoxS-ISF9 TaxID=1458670 RepID=W8NNN2_9CAUD|nr:hypothetical protein ISF9_085 [Microbacterium phage vB_MoxS-ISF9]AHL18555.1 hypothetical protein ISF9_085 [Microbacterium phage vB_MoxS-ISF9]